ncbi:MAG: hypothetical protein MSA09_08045 [Lachnospiraceae bacterium]|nr:hypothetical protein [Lachnospiraceae bacterium]MDD7177112.1 hypothetical protein [bacterium]MDY5517758.1 hypothetical protein [Lachnospiraceae bacterium]
MIFVTLAGRRRSSAFFSKMTVPVFASMMSADLADGINEPEALLSGALPEVPAAFSSAVVSYLMIAFGVTAAYTGTIIQKMIA